jgi:hypothetical protein
MAITVVAAVTLAKRKPKSFLAVTERIAFEETVAAGGCNVGEPVVSVLPP